MKWISVTVPALARMMQVVVFAVLVGLAQCQTQNYATVLVTLHDGRTQSFASAVGAFSG